MFLPYFFVLFVFFVVQMAFCTGVFYWLFDSSSHRKLGMLVRKRRKIGQHNIGFIIAKKSGIHYSTFAFDG